VITSRCPSCGAPLTFPHAAAPSAVCESCRTTVLRDGPELRALGKISSMARDLSPIQIGARGEFGSKSFEVIGVLRKARERVRWNEWFLVFDDGDTGWLGEGNGELTLFEGAALNWPGAKPAVGAEVELAGRVWKATEVAEAAAVAADGALPEPVTQDQAFAYADLRTADGRAFGTLDWSDTPARFYVGRPVTLPALKLRGLRHFAGWSDPALVDFQGPEIEAVRSLTCNSCGAPVSLRSPGDAVRVVCEFCGGELAVEDSGEEIGLKVISQGQRQGFIRWKPPLALGSRGKLKGVEWEVIGAADRYVRVDGIDYHWVEHFLHNPYRGYAWLVCDGQRHWNYIQRLTEHPSGGRLGGWDPVAWRGDTFKHFQSGTARVYKVIGEFTWEIRAGDEAQTVDYISPPRMLSVERTRDEIAWTLGTWLPPEEVSTAFSSPQGPAEGVALNQPNPYDGARGQIVGRVAAMLAAVVVLWITQSVLWSSDLLVDTSWSYDGAENEVWVSPEFAVDTGAGLEVELSTPLSRRGAVVHVALINLDDGAVLLPKLADYSDNSGDAVLTGATPGRYVARVEVARDPVMVVGQTDLRLKVTQDVPWRTPLVMTGLFIMLAPVFLVAARGQFESARWMNSDHAQ
jgi:hypothetical protein